MPLHPHASVDYLGPKCSCLRSQRGRLRTPKHVRRALTLAPRLSPIYHCIRTTTGRSTAADVRPVRQAES